MKTRGKKTASGRGVKHCKAPGQKIAAATAMVQEYTSANYAKVYPIDTLLVGQLETLLQDEQALRDRYSRISSSTDSIETRMAFSDELAELKDRADRLYRLVNEMDRYGSYLTSYPSSTGVAA